MNNNFNFEVCNKKDEVIATFKTKDIADYFASRFMKRIYRVVDLEEVKKEELSKPIITLNLIKELTGDSYSKGVFIGINLVHQVRMNGLDVEMALFDKDLNYIVDLLDYDSEQWVKVMDRMYDEVIGKFGEYSGETLGSLFSEEVKANYKIGRVFGAYDSETKKNERRFGGQKSFTGTYICEEGFDS